MNGACVRFVRAMFCHMRYECAVCACGAVAGAVRVRGVCVHCTPQLYTRTVHCAVLRKHGFVSKFC